MTDFHVTAVRVGKVEKLANSDNLSITHVLGGYPCIIKTGDFKEGDMACYVPVDCLVPVDRPEFSWLKTKRADNKHRVRAIRLRGTFSMGLLVPTPYGTNEGDDLAEAFGITKYEPPAERESTDQRHEQTRKARKSETRRFDLAMETITLAFSAIAWLTLPPAFAFAVSMVFVAVGLKLIAYNRSLNTKPNIPIYDLENVRRHINALKEGEEVILHEKIHGCNARFIHTGKKFHVSSRTMFRTGGEDNWWKAAKKYDLEAKLAKKPGMVLFGEIYGASCQDLDYGVARDDIGFAAFDVMDAKTREYLNVSEFRAFCQELDIPMVPVLYQGPWSRELLSHADGKSIIAPEQIREGFVVRPLEERKEHGLGRCVLKLAGESFLLRGDA